MKDKLYSLLIFIGKISYVISIIHPILLAISTNGTLQIFWIIVSFCLICYFLEQLILKSKFENNFKYIIELKTSEKNKLKLLSTLIQDYFKIN